jgi:glycosyltransferase involved in cell wall biosynthesis
MRVLQVIGGISPEWVGPATAVLGMSSALAGQGHQVTIFTTNIRGRGDFRSHPKRTGFLDVPLNVPVSRDGVEIWHFAVDWPSWWATSWAMARALSSAIKRFDIVHIHSIYLFSTTATALYCWRARVPYLIAPHGMLDPLRRNRRRLGKVLYHALLERRNLDRAGAIHYTCEGEKRAAASMNLRAPSTVIPLGITLLQYKDLPSRGAFRVVHPNIGDKKIVLFLGRICFQKGLDLLATAFAELVQTRNDLHLVIAGPDSEDYGSTVRRLLDEKGGLTHTTFPGLLVGQEKLAALRDADLWVLPSRTDSFPIGAVEAMACGLPLVVTDRVHLWPEIQDAGAGLVVAPEIKELREAISSLVDDEGLRARLGQNARRLAVERFDWDRVVPQLLEVYRRVVSGGLDLHTSEVV